MKVAILSGSVYGTAEDVARHAERQLKAAGFDAWLAKPLDLAALAAALNTALGGPEVDADGRERA